MQAIGFNGADFIEFEKEIELPLAHDLLVEIRAISINPIDAKVKQTIDNNKSPVILGFDACGIVLEVGNKTSLFKVGDEIFYAGDVTRDGSNATHQLVDERVAGRKPTTFSFAQAAALPLTSITAWESLFDRLKITSSDRGKTLLLIGAAGGVGSMAIQFAKQLIGVHVVATASRQESQDWCKKMGADVVINHYDLLRQFKDNNLEAPNFILCMGDPDDYFEIMTELIAPQGSICLLANAGRDYNLNLLKAKSITLVWEMMFTRSMFATDDLIQQHDILNKVADLIDSGKVKATLTKTLTPINTENIVKAHSIIEKREMIGKLTITR